MKFLCAVIFATLVLFQRIDALQLFDGEVFAISKETIVERLNNRVATHINLVDESRMIVDAEFDHFEGNDSAVKEISNMVQADIGKLIDGYNKELTDIKDNDKCEKIEASESINQAKETAQNENTNILNGYNDAADKESIPLMYQVTVALHDGARNPLMDLVNGCSKEHSSANHLILACVGLGIQDFNKKWTQAKLETGEWKTSSQSAIKAAVEATRKLSALKDAKNFDNIRSSLKKLKECVKDNETPEERVEN